MRAPESLSIIAYGASEEALEPQLFDSVDRVIVKLTYRRAMASAQWLPLTMALSRLGGHPVSVQAPATIKLAIGLRWMGRCDFVPGLSERMALGIVRRWVNVIVFPGIKSLNDLSSSEMSIARLESGRACVN